MMGNIDGRRGGKGKREKRGINTGRGGGQSARVGVSILFGGGEYQTSFLVGAGTKKKEPDRDGRKSRQRNLYASKRAHRHLSKNGKEKKESMGGFAGTILGKGSNRTPRVRRGR